MTTLDDEPKFKHKAVRVEWQVVAQPIDQYGKSRGNRIVFESFPTVEAARAALPEYGYPHPFLENAWMPDTSLYGDTSYVRLVVQYREVVVGEWEA